MEIGESGERSGDWAEEVVIGEVEVDELGEFGDEWGQGARVAGRVERELGDSEGIGSGGAGEAAGEVGDFGERARVGGEVPGG